MVGEEGGNGGWVHGQLLRRGFRRNFFCLKIKFTAGVSGMRAQPSANSGNDLRQNAHRQTQIWPENVQSGFALLALRPIFIKWREERIQLFVFPFTDIGNNKN